MLISLFNKVLSLTAVVVLLTQCNSSSQAHDGLSAPAQTPGAQNPQAEATASPTPGSGSNAQNVTRPTTDASQDVQQECGVDLAALAANPNQTIFQTTMTSEPIVESGELSDKISTLNALSLIGGIIGAVMKIFGDIQYNISVTVTNTIHSTSLTSTSNITYTDTVSPQMIAGTVTSQLDSNLKGEIDSVPLSQNDFSKVIGSLPDWQNVVCVILPVTKITTTRNSKKTVVTFSPALPNAISPKGSQSRYQTEIGNGRTFGGITATVVQSGTDTLQTGQVISGSVDVMPISTSTQMPSGTVLTGDVAYLMRFNFIDAAHTSAMGLTPQISYFISNSKRAFTGIVADTRDGQTPPAVFTHFK